MNQCINNIRQTLAHWLLFNKNVSLFEKIPLKSLTMQQTTHQSGTKLCRIDTIGPAQCCLTDLAILKAKILNNFKDRLSSAIFIKQHSITVYFNSMCSHGSICISRASCLSPQEPRIISFHPFIIPAIPIPVQVFTLQPVAVSFFAWLAHAGSLYLAFEFDSLLIEICMSVTY